MLYDYDVVVIGAGPAGEGAAMKLTKEGKKKGKIQVDLLEILLSLSKEKIFFFVTPFCSWL